jgi:hypothetical protein
MLETGHGENGQQREREPDTEMRRRGGLDVLETHQSLERMIWWIVSQYAEPAGSPPNVEHVLDHLIHRS